jgi:hypothetical protein
MPTTVFASSSDESGFAAVAAGVEGTTGTTAPDDARPVKDGFGMTLIKRYAVLLN